MKRKLIAIFLCFSLIVSSVSPAYARSNAGGGDMAEFDMGRAFTGLAVNVASNFVGGFLRASVGSVIHGASFNFGQALRQIFSFESLLDNLTGLTNKIAMKYVQKAVAAYGQYHEWKGSQIFLVAGIASSLIGAYVGADTSTMSAFREAFPSMLRQAISGSVETAVTYAIDKKNLDDKDNKKGASTKSRIAGMVAGELVNMGMLEIEREQKKAEVAEGNMGAFLELNAMEPAVPSFFSSILTRSMSIAITNNLSEKKQYLSPLIEAAIDGVAGSLIREATGSVVNMPGINSGIMQINNPNGSGNIPSVNSGRIPTSTFTPNSTMRNTMPTFRATSNP